MEVSRARAMLMAESIRPLLALLVSAMTCAAAAQPPTPSSEEETPAGVGIKVSFRPSVAIVVGIFTMIFSLTFLLLMYAKFCHPSSAPPLLPTTSPAPVVVNQPAAGVPKTIVQSLPFFRFSALRGARQGLECAVCLARFDDADLLRLLPRCRHAFHLDCVDRWLETSASCPLCRTCVDADELGLKYAASARFVFGGGDDSELSSSSAAASGRDILAGIFVERVPSSRFAPPQEQELELELELDRHKHRIVVSDVVFKSRWSDLNSAALIALDTEMLGSMSSRRFELEFDDPPPYPAEYFREDAVVKEETTTDKKRLLETSSLGACSSSSAIISSGGVRSMSEIIRLPRVRAAAATEEEERARRRWVPIARRTARWFAGRERLAAASASGVEDDHASSSSRL